MELVKTQTNNRIPDGYKSTELGVIPEDWEQIKLSEITTFIGSGSTSTKGKGDYPLMGSTGIIGTCNKPEYTGKAILVARVGANAGKINYVVGNYGVSDNTILIKIKKEIELNFVKELLLHKNLNSLVFGSGQPLITGSQLKGLIIPLPPTLKEQKAIAGALSDVDALISSLDQLISKKKAIKQGALQELLTPPDKGGKRLPGFDGEWEEKTLGDIGQCIIGLTYSPGNVKDSGTLVLRSSNIQNNRFSSHDNVYVDIEIPEKLRIQNNDILVCVRNGSRNLIGKSLKLTNDLVGQTWGAFMSVFRSEYNDYLEHLFNSNIIQKQIEENLGATINQITNKTMNSFRVVIPADEKEQKAIAKILSDMDKAIDHLEAKKAKYKQIKQGMMRDLLTGKIRLV